MGEQERLLEKCPSDDELALLLDASKAPERVASLLAHLDRCVSCHEMTVALVRHSLRSETEPSTGGGDRNVLEVQPGSVVGRYVVLEHVGAGGMGVVYAAYDPVLDRKVALKLVRSRTVRRQEGVARRVTEEALVLARLSHPNIVTVFDAGEHEGFAYLAMELVEGSTLRTWLASKRRAREEILAVLRDAGEGLLTIHEARFIHRDFKPENVLIDRAGRARVTDFGLAVTFAAAREGELAGTARYMAPEQLRAERADARSDAFAFGVTAYEALTGVLPPVVHDVATGQFALADQTRLLTKYVRRDVARAVARALSVDPAERGGAVRDFVRATTRRPRARVLTFAALSVACLLVASFVVGERRARTSSLCQGGAARLAEVWGAPQREAVARGFRRLSDVPFAGAAGEGAIAALDRYGAGWVAAYSRTCEATHVRGEQSAAMLDESMACLDARRRELEVVVGALSTPDSALARRAIESVDSVSSVRACLDPAATKGSGRTDPARRVRFDELARIKGSVDVGRHGADDRRRISIALADAEAVHDAFAEAEAEVLLGDVQHMAGEWEQAEDSFVAAVHASERSGDVAEEASAWIRLSELAGLDQMHTADAKRDADHAEALLARVSDPMLAGRLLQARGETAFRAGAIDEAVEVLGRAIASFVANDRAESLEVASCLWAMGSALTSAGHLAEARKALVSALDMRKRLLGPSSPQVAVAENGLGRLDLAEGKYEDATEHFEAALAIRRGDDETPADARAKLLNNLAIAAVSLHRMDEARTRFAEAASTFRSALGDHPLAAQSLGNVAELDLTQGRATDARTEYEDALALLLRSGATARDIEARIRLGLGRSELAIGHVDAGVAALTAALAIYAAGTFDPGDRANTELALAGAMKKRGDRPVAEIRALAEQARDHFRQAPAHAAGLEEAEAFLRALR